MRLLILLCLVLSGCATIIGGDSESIYFTSEPSGAVVIIDSQKRGNTPLHVELKTGNTHDVKCIQDGYFPEFYQIDTEFDLVAILDYLFPPAIIVDMLTGADQDFEHNEYHVVFTPHQAKVR